MIREFFTIRAKIKGIKAEFDGLLKYLDELPNKDAHCVHLNRYFTRFIEIHKYTEHRFCKNELSSVYYLKGVRIENPSAKCTGRQPYKILAI